MLRALTVSCVVIWCTTLVWAADPAARSNLAAEALLPQGPGIAVESGGDAGLRAHPDVIFADDFESGKLGEGVRATPVLLEGRVYLRGDKNLFAVGAK